MVKIVKQDFRENKRLYDKIEGDLRKELNETVPITQVGSTAIPDMYGKNIIDILIGSNDDKQFDEIAQVLLNKGFFASTKSQDGIYQFFSSTEKETSSGDIHIHLVKLNTNRYIEFIILRDYLLNNKDEALAYSNFKKEIISKGIVERKEYKSIKSEYVTKLLDRAKKYSGYNTL